MAVNAGWVKTILSRWYTWLYKATAREDEKGEYSGGRIQGAIRQMVLGLCDGITGQALEIGTGTGLFLLKLALRNPDLKIWSVDSKDEFLVRSAKKMEDKNLHNVYLLHEDARKLSFDDDTFDLVICINFFIDSDIDLVIGTLKEMKRVSKTSGRIIFEFRNSRNLLFRLKYALAGYYDPTAPTTLYTYNPDKFDGILKDLNLEVLSKKYMGFPIKYFAPIIIVEARKR